MADLCTFNSTKVPSRCVRNMKIIGAYEVEIEIECATKTLSEYTTLAAFAAPIGIQQLKSGRIKIQTEGGTKASLVLNGTTYSGCYIKEITNAEADGMQFGLWVFTITFVQETAP